jgi:predicted metal-binding membrane protein
MVEGEAIRSPRDLLRSLTLPIAVIIAVVVAASWYVTWVTTDITMAFIGMPTSSEGAIGLTLAFLLLVVMMVAMMLPSALPMVITYAGLTRLEGGHPVRPTDRVSTAFFASAYFVVWGFFGVVALLGLMLLGIFDPMNGSSLLVSAVILIAAGAFQVTRTKEVCLAHCQSPMGFVMTHWRSGRRGAW